MQNQTSERAQWSNKYYCVFQKKGWKNLLEQVGVRVEPCVAMHLTGKEKERLEDLSLQIKALVLPNAPQGVFDIYRATLLQIGNNVSRARAQQMWREQSSDVQSIYEEKAQDQYCIYQIEFERVSLLRESIFNEIDSILAASDMDQFITPKRVSPYRVFKREIASLNKEEYPNMRSQERQMIVKEKWHRIPEHERALFVVKARLEEERNNYNSVQKFYRQRVGEAKATISEASLKSLLHDVMKSFPSQTVTVLPASADSEIHTKEGQQAPVDLASTLVEEEIPNKDSTASSVKAEFDSSPELSPKSKPITIDNRLKTSDEEEELISLQTVPTSIDNPAN